MAWTTSESNTLVDGIEVMADAVSLPLLAVNSVALGSLVWTLFV